MFKFKIGDTVGLKMSFAQTTSGDTSALHGFVVTQRKNVRGEPNYKLKGYTGYYPETILFKEN
jgi:hypothetical protein